jgi:hypothetical protein
MSLQIEVLCTYEIPRRFSNKLTVNPVLLSYECIEIKCWCNAITWGIKSIVSSF